MVEKSIEVYDETSNYAIVRMPGRAFPGCVVQGDSLAILLGHARVVLDRARLSPDEELVGEAEELVEHLESRLAHYESVLRAHGIRRPY
jgi:hypothetical protein